MQKVLVKIKEKNNNKWLHKYIQVENKSIDKLKRMWEFWARDQKVTSNPATLRH